MARLDAESVRADCNPGRRPRWQLEPTSSARAMGAPAAEHAADAEVAGGRSTFHQRAATTCRFELEVPPGATLSFSVRADEAVRPQRGNARIAIALVGDVRGDPASPVVFEEELEPGRSIEVDALALRHGGDPANALELRHVSHPRGPAVAWSELTLTLESDSATPPSGWTTPYSDAVAQFAAERPWPPPSPDPNRPTERPRLLIIGVDGASWPLLDELIADGDVPHLAALAERGRRGTLVSTFLPESAMAWTSLRTGVTAGHHGVYHFMSIDEARRSYWSWLDDAGLRSLVIGVPKSSPAEPFDGVLVGGWDMNARQDFTRPDRLAAYLRRAGYDPAIANVADTVRFAARMRDRTDLALALLDHLDWDHAFVVYEYSDTAGHRFGLQTEGWRTAYRQLDHEIGRLLAGLPQGTTVLVVSDHGWRRFERAFSPGAWLRTNGFTNWMTHIYGGHRVALRAATPFRGDEEAEAVAALSEAMQGVVDPDTGERVVARVMPFEEGIAGPFSARSNLRAFIELDPRYHAAAMAKGDEVWPDVTPEHHDVDGLYLLVGPGVEPGQGRAASVLDVAPTAAAFFGVHPPEDIGGEPIDGIVQAAPITSAPAIGTRRSTSPGDDPATEPSDELRESLRALGYIDEGE